MFLKKVIKAFNKKNINYALVGGYALSLHGAVRGTVDIDLIISLTEKNLKLAKSALEEIGLQNHLPISPKELFEFKDEYIKKKNLIAWNFTNPSNPAESVDIIMTQDLKDTEIIQKKLGTLKINIISIKGLIKMKKQAGRPQDLEDIKALEKLK